MRRIALWAGCLLACVAAAQTVDIAELKQKAAAGDVKAQIALGRAYERGEGVPQNDELAVKWYRAAAEQGSAEAQNSLGIMYRVGRGVEKDFEKAREWYLKAARQNYGAALFNLGTLYYNGDGVGISDSMAYAYFVLAKEAGSKEGAEAAQRSETELSPGKLADAKLYLAGIVDDGEFGPPNPARAKQIYEETAKAGSLTAEVRLGKMYMNGAGVAKDLAKARKYCSQAAKDKYSPAMVCLAVLAQTAETPDMKSAANWYKQAAELGNPIAMFNLGVMYAKGSGVKQDNLAAYRLFNELMSAGYRNLVENAATVVKARLTPKEQAQMGKAYPRTRAPVDKFAAGEFAYVMKLE